MKHLSRRDFLARTTSASLGAAAGFGLPLTPRNRPPGPSIYWTSSQIAGLRSVDDVRMAARSGRTGKLYSTIRQFAAADTERPPITPSDPLPNRDAASIANNSPDFWVTNEAAQRVLRSAFVAVVEDNPSLGAVALSQMEVLFDPSIWEGWIDKAHLRFGHPAGLRTGMLAEAVGLAFDWLRPHLSNNEKNWITAGIDRCAIQPFLESRNQNAWWLQDLNNWLTTIVGGVGIAAMALGPDHHQSSSIVDYATRRMEEYLSIYGPEGEFNESVHYANATVRPVSYFQALRYWSGGSENRLAQHPFPQTCLWQLYLTLPPGRVAAFGDARPYAAPWSRHFAAVASATRSPILQGFYLEHSTDNGDPIELLWFDEKLEGESPAGSLAKGRYFPAHGGCMVSRSDWDPDEAKCIVYGKSGREENHEHNDVGQLCIDAHGERLIIDIGSPKPTYPDDFFDEGRYEYYNASALGHNLLTFDSEEQRYPVRARGEPIGTMAEELSGGALVTRFDDDLGAIWQVDLTPAYTSAASVRRTLIHLLPGFVVVLDEATTERDVTARLRWHTIGQCEPNPSGRFLLETDTSRVNGVVACLSGMATFQAGRHRYVSPYNMGRGGIPLEQHQEPFIEAVSSGNHFRFLSLFSVGRAGSEKGVWSHGSNDHEWVFGEGDDSCRVVLADARMTVRSNRRELTVAV